MTLQTHWHLLQRHPQTLTEAACERQRTALITHSFASELLFRRRAGLLALHEADHASLTDCSRSGHPIDCVECSHTKLTIVECVQGGVLGAVRTMVSHGTCTGYLAT